jgi:hypothetical protein
MFTGFASENTPAFQVWDLSNTYSGTARLVLQDDCAPIQIIKTGGSNTQAQLFLPTSPVEGITIKIVNCRYGSESQTINVFSSDTTQFNNIFTVGPGQYVETCFVSSMRSFGQVAGVQASGWVTINQASSSNSNAYGVVVGGLANRATSQYSGVLAGNGNSASGTRAGVLGGIGNTSGGTDTGVVGGNSNFITGDRAASLGGQSNQASNTNAVVAGGSGNTASGDRSAVLGGTSSTASQYASAVVGGDTNVASNSHSVVIGGQNNTANSINSVVVGGRRGTTRAIDGNFVTSASNAPIAASIGVQQLATLLLGRQTTDATATRLTSDLNAGATTNQVILPNNSAYTFQGTCIANVTGGGATSGWKFEGVIKRGANAASTALVAAVTPLVIAQDAGAVTWVLAITADTTNGGIAVTVTGQAATTIRWVAKIETTEVTF